MAEKLDPRQVVTFEELLRAMMFEMEGYTANTCAEGPADQRGGVGGGHTMPLAMLEGQGYWAH